MDNERLKFRKQEPIVARMHTNLTGYSTSGPMVVVIKKKKTKGSRRSKVAAGRKA